MVRVGIVRTAAAAAAAAAETPDMCVLAVAVWAGGLGMDVLSIFRVYAAV
jgi:hypothetical protein